MKINYLTSLAFGLLSSAMVSAQTFSEPVEYLNYFNAEFFELQKLQVEYMSLLVHTQGNEADQKRVELQNQLNNAYQKFSNVSAYAKDNGLKNNAVQTIKAMLEITAQNHDATIQQKTGCTDCFETIAMDAEYTAKDGKELEKNMSKMNKSIEKFAKENNIKIVSDESQYDKIIGKVNKINDYLQALNLVVLQMQYADDKVISALNKQDIGAAKDAFKKFNKAVDEAKKRFDKLERIPEDYTCTKKVEVLYTHYKQAADKYYPAIFSAFDKNGKIINDKVDTYNQNIQKLNEGSARGLQGYYEARQNLLQKNVPQPSQQSFKL